MAVDKARDRVESGDSRRERNAVFRPQGPDAARMDFFNGLLRLFESVDAQRFEVNGRRPACDHL